MQMLTGEVIAVDANLKIPRYGAVALFPDVCADSRTRLMKEKGVSPYKALYVIMNEFGEILGWYLLRTEQHEELRPLLLGLKQRLEKRGAAPPTLVYTDRCCQVSLCGTVHPSLLIMCQRNAGCFTVSGRRCKLEADIHLRGTRFCQFLSSSYSIQKRR
jgi:hypothetical protein